MSLQGIAIIVELQRGASLQVFEEMAFFELAGPNAEGLHAA